MSKKNRNHRVAPAVTRAAVSERAADGRVYLVLHRDSTGNERVTFSAPVFDVAWLDEVALGTVNTTLGVFGEQPSFARAATLAERAMVATSRLTEALLSRAKSGAVACRAGCDHCCHQSVSVTPPEALAVVAHLRETLAPDALASFAVRLAERVERTRELSTDERFSPELPCLFLRDGSCSIYAVRPLVCRGMNSLDAAECQRRLRDANARAEFLARGAGGHCFVEPIQASQAVSAGLQLGGSELYALDMRPLDLAAALLLLLEGDATLERAWLDGEKPLEAAVQHQASLNPRP
jgi:Fe-S-cluster containining protein